MKGRVYRSAAREFDCIIESSGEKIVATALGNLLKKEESIVVGDYVKLDTIPETGEYQISEVLERENHIYRYIVREGKKKITAANCDLLVILISVSKPKFKQGLIDRFLIRSSEWEIPAVVVFNKMDEFDESFDLSFEEERLKELGANCFEISAKLGEEYKPRFLKKGITDLKEYLKGKTSIFVGQSGVGKSKSITELSDGKVDLKTKEIGKVGKGSHTTTWSELIDCGDFLLIDSPGIRSFSLEDILSEDLIYYFPDIHKLAVTCKFNNCEHLKNSKGCAFLEHRGSDDIGSKAIISRLESFQKIMEEVSETPSWKKT